MREAVPGRVSREGGQTPAAEQSWWPRFQHNLDVSTGSCQASGWVSSLSQGHRSFRTSQVRMSFTASQAGATLLPFSVETCGAVAPDAVKLLQLISRAS